MVKPGVRNIANKELPFRRQLFLWSVRLFKAGTGGAISVVCINFLPYPALDREEVV